MNKIILSLLVCMLATSGCSQVETQKNSAIEAEIKNIVASYATSIATLKADAIISLIHEQKNLLMSDDIYMEKNRASIVYGFEISDSSLSVKTINSINTLIVRIPEGKKISIDREKIDIKSTHANYFPQHIVVDGKKIAFDLDAEINKKILDFEQKYNTKNIKLAEDNLYKFFTLVAAKYGLDLNFKIESNQQIAIQKNS